MKTSNRPTAPLPACPPALTPSARTAVRATALLCATLLGAFSAAGQTATWVGGNTNGPWSNTNNWSPKFLPLNGGGTNYTVIVPDSTSLSFDVPGGGAIDALSFGVGSRLLATNGQSLTVNGVAVIKGQVQARGDGSGFTAPANTVVLSSNPQFFATNGATIAVGASTYTWDRSIGSATLLSAVGTNSVVDLHGLTSMLLNFGNSGPTYSIFARSNGLVNLSGLPNLTGPGSSGWLELTADTGGQIRLDAVRQLSQNVRFNIAVPAFELPQAVSLDSVTINQTAAGGFIATNLQTIANSTISDATGGFFDFPDLAAITNTAINVSTGTVFSAPQLWSLNSVPSPSAPLTIAGTGSFRATNLVSYINSTILIQPGRDFQSGVLTNIYGSSILVSNGGSYRVATAAYEMPAAGYYVYAPRYLFQSSGAGSALDLSSIRTLRTYSANVVWDAVENRWRGDWTFYVSAANQGNLDLSGLDIAYGADPNSNGGDDWLSFRVETGGTLQLPNLKVVTRRTRFDLLTPQFSLPSLQSVDHTLFNLQDGGRVDLPSLTNFNSSSISFGFNSTFSAPALRTFVNSTLNLAPGQILDTPAFTNIDSSQLGVSSGSTLAVAAAAYQAPGGISATVFSANGAGSVLNLASIGSLTTVPGDSGHTYTVAVNNNGLINLSGLQSVQAGSDAWTFSLLNNGTIQLPSLQQVSGTVAFQLGDGSRLDAPSLTRVADGTSISFGAGAVFNAPALVEYVNSDLSFASPGAFASLPLTNIYASRLAVGGGATLRVAARSYEIPAYGYYVYPGSPSRLAAEGAGSLLDLSLLQSIRMYGVNVGWNPLISQWRGDWDFTVSASSQAVIDLSALQLVFGADPNNYSGGDDWLSFNARSGGSILFGNVSSSQRTRFTAADPNSTLDFAGLYLRAPGVLTAGPSSTLRIRGDFRFENTDTNSLNGDLATLLLDGSAPQRLEVGGRDVGPAPAVMQGNFGFGQLIVGNTNRPGIVRLEDSFYNLGRGAAGEPESLYLYGLGGQGLRLHSGSRLILRQLNAYATINGSMVNLRSLLPPGANSVAFDAGFIANYGGPSITNLTPSTSVTPSVSSVDVSFNLPIQPASFSVADIQLTGPSGPITPTSLAPVSGTTWRISFPTQTADGLYTVRVGPAVNELAANFLGMDQNGDGSSGDPTDGFTGSFTIDGTAPHIVQALALQNGTRIGVTFDEPVAPGFATNVANYNVNGLTPTNATLYGTFSGGLLREIFTSLSGSYVSNLTFAPSYPNSPALTNWTTDYFESPRGVGDNYGQRMHGYVIPPVTGIYTFWLAGDDTAALYLSNDDQPANQVLIAYTTSATGWRNWTSQSSQKSNPVLLQAGQRYYICALQKESTGDDYLSVRWTRPDAVDEAPIPATWFLPYGRTSAPEPMRVALGVPLLVGNSFSLTVSNAADRLGNTGNDAFTGSILTVEDRDIGTTGSNPAIPGSTLTFNGDDFEMRAGGSDFFTGSSDAGHFAAETRYGDFDVQVQVGGLTSADSCTQAGLMWRESTAANSRRVYVCLNPPGQCNGFSAWIRSTPGAAATEWPGYTRPGVPSFSYAYAWIRLQRQGDLFTAYTSLNGVDWIPYAQITRSLPAVGIVGPASSARNNASVATIWYKNFGDRVPSIVAQPQSQTVASGSTVAFGVNARGLPALGYQWFFNGLPLNAATGSLLTLNSVALTNVGDYRCVVTNNYGATTSLVATLVVDGLGAGGFEGDLMPAPYGDNAVTISDWVKVGRLVAGLDSVLNSSEFQRVDSAPRLTGTNLTLGDGRLSVADWTQSGRYTAALDPLTPAGGPLLASGASPAIAKSGSLQKSLGRTLVAASSTAWQGAEIDVPVILSGADGVENALGFSLVFDPSSLAYVGASLGKDAPGASLIPNAVRAKSGQLGFALALPVGQALGSGTLELARVRFVATGAGPAALQIVDSPVVCELVDLQAATLPMSVNNSTVTVLPRPGLASLEMLPAGGVQLILTGQPGLRCVLQSSTNLVNWTTLSTNTLLDSQLTVVDPAPPAGQARFYRLAPVQ